MSKKSIASDILSGLNAIATPQTLTTQIATGVINSNYTKETIRKFLLDPVQRKIVPKYKGQGPREMSAIIYSIYMLCGDQLLKELFDITSDLQKTKFNKDAEDYPPFNLMRIYIPEAVTPRSILFKYKGTIIYLQYRYDEDKYNFYASVYFVGSDSKKVYKEFMDAMDKADYLNGKGWHEKNKRKVTIYSFEHGRPRYGTCTVPTTIIVDHVQDSLDTITKSIKISEDISNKYALNKTTGILLYGPHGTGKSTLVRYLAMELNRSIVLAGADDLESAITFIKDRSERQKMILLIEDIDFKFIDRRKTEKDGKDNAMMAQTDLLFQLLDGVLSENNLVVCATTNYIDRLDPALIRDGRFDYRLEVLGLSYENAVKVCERFDVDPDEIKLKEWDTPITPASLQTFILKYKTTV